MDGHVFISHSRMDDATVAAIRDALVAAGVQVWEDTRLLPGDQLSPEIVGALDASRSLIAVLSPRTINSKWVTNEIRYSLGLQRQRGPAYRVIPVMIDGVEPSALHLWFPEEPVGLKLGVGPEGIQEALPALLAGLGLAEETTPVEALPVTELTLELSDPFVETEGGKHRGGATARLTYRSAEGGAPASHGPRFRFVAPIGPIEAEDLRWYLERYVSWPSGVFQERARGVEAKLPEWGRKLHTAAFEHPSSKEYYEAWKHEGGRAVRRLTILVDRELMKGGSPGETENNPRQAEADEAASLLLGLPWELLHDDAGYLFLEPSLVRVRRGLPNQTVKRALATVAPLRVLLLSPRPEDDRAGYIDHRVSARPVVEALASLGELAKLTILRPPTFDALIEELVAAQQNERPYHVVHFDGHGVYSQRTGLGALCFEHGEDVGKLDRRRSHVVDAAELATTVAEKLPGQRLPLFFLEACQTAATEKDPMASVAGTLLQGGVASVVAMSHSVLVETARRFVTAFYQELLAGRRIGEAMVEGQRALQADPFRYRTFQGELHLQDWFVPVLYQEEDDPQLIREVPAQRMREVQAREQVFSLGALPEEPKHGFVGRSRELLAAERLLEVERYVVLRGEGGEGKTTLAAELARWLVATGRYERAAFASMEKHGDARSLLLEVGSQLLDNFGSLTGQDEGLAMQELERVLRERPTLVVLDNMESVLPPEPGAASEGAFEPEVLRKVLDLAAALRAVGETRVVLTTRQPVPEPFADNHVTIGRLERNVAIELVARTLGREESAPRADDAGESDDEVIRLVDAVGCHARSLVLLAGEVAASGVRNATEHLADLMAVLQERHPEDRERSLYASVELSLLRLPDGMRERIRPLGVFRGGGHLLSMASVLGLDPGKPELIRGIATALVHVGLAELLEFGYLRLDPALGPLLWQEMNERERVEARRGWADAVTQLTGFLYEQQFSDNPRMVTEVTLLDLPNLLGALEELLMSAPAEVVVEVATRVESLLQNLGRPKALAQASRVREGAGGNLGEWGHIQYVAQRQALERLLDAGRFQEAFTLAKSVLGRTQAAGENAYEGASYDLGTSLLMFGRVLEMSGDPAAALFPLQDARSRFELLAAGEDSSAVAMRSVAMTEIGDCLRALGRLGEAASVYEAVIEIEVQRGAVRSAALGKGQLGTVRRLQRRYNEALAAYEEARQTFEQLGETRVVGGLWQKIGMVYRRAGQHDQAEKAYQASLRIRVQTGDRNGEAGTLNELGNLYDATDRLEEAVRFYQQATTIFRDLDDLANEGLVCHNLADTLLRLGRHDEARREIIRANECKGPFGHALEPWKDFEILSDLERVAGNMTAASAARKQAIEAYLAYRRDGGESLSGGGAIFSHVAEAIAADQTPAAQSGLAELSDQPDLPGYLRPLLPKLQTILNGSRDMSLADDPELDYDDAVELRLLLEHLAAPGT